VNRRDVDLHVHTRTSNCGFTSHARVLQLARAAGHRPIWVQSFFTRFSRPTAERTLDNAERA